MPNIIGRYEVLQKGNKAAIDVAMLINEQIRLQWVASITLLPCVPSQSR